MSFPRGSSAFATTGLLAPAANPQAREDAQTFMRRVAQVEINTCPHCKLGRWRVPASLFDALNKPANEADDQLSLNGRV